MSKSEKMCPIGLASELGCDKWMRIILRDIGLFERRTFNKLLKHNLEGISSGSLATKLKRLEQVGLITCVSASEHKQKKLYFLTESGINFARTFQYGGVVFEMASAEQGVFRCHSTVCDTSHAQVTNVAVRIAFNQSRQSILECIRSVDRRNGAAEAVLRQLF